MAVEKVVVS
jgi:hypothetical protein